MVTNKVLNAALKVIEPTAWIVFIVCVIGIVITLDADVYSAKAIQCNELKGAYTRHRCLEAARNTHIPGFIATAIHHRLERYNHEQL